MKQPSSLTPRDWELISAFLDEQLSDHDRAHLVARLAHEPKLGQALAELRGLRTALRDLPPAPPPRNFTLSPEMIGAQRSVPARRALSLGWGSALATLVLGLVLVADLGRSFGLAAERAAPALQSASGEHAPAVFLPPTAGAPLASNPGEGQVAADQMATNAQAQAQASALPLPSGTPETPMFAAKGAGVPEGTALPGVPAGNVPLGGGELPTAAPPGAIQTSPTVGGEVSPAPLPASTGTPAANPQAEAQAPVPTSAPAEPRGLPSLLIWRAAEAVLALLAFGLGAAAIVSSRAQR